MSVTPRKCPARSRASGFREGVGAGLLLQLGGSRRESGRFPPQVLPCSTPAAEGVSCVAANFTLSASLQLVRGQGREQLVLALLARSPSLPPSSLKLLASSHAKNSSASVALEISLRPCATSSWNAGSSGATRPSARVAPRERVPFSSPAPVSSPSIS